MKCCRLLLCLCWLSGPMFSHTASADPIVYTMSVTVGGVTHVGDPQTVAGFLIEDGTVSYARLIDALTATLMAAVSSGTLLDVVSFVGFDGGVTPAPMIGTYTFTNVLFLGLSFNGTAELGSFTAATTTFTPIPEPGTLALFLLAGLPLVWRIHRRRAA